MLAIYPIAFWATCLESFGFFYRAMHFAYTIFMLQRIRRYGYNWYFDYFLNHLFFTKYKICFLVNLLWYNHCWNCIFAFQSILICWDSIVVAVLTSYSSRCVYVCILRLCVSIKMYEITWIYKVTWHYLMKIWPVARFNKWYMMIG